MVQGLRRRVFSLGGLGLTLGQALGGWRSLGRVLGLLGGFCWWCGGEVEEGVFRCLLGLVQGGGEVVSVVLVLFSFSWCQRVQRVFVLVFWRFGEGRCWFVGRGGAWLLGALLGRWCCPCRARCFWPAVSGFAGFGFVFGQRWVVSECLGLFCLRPLGTTTCLCWGGFPRVGLPW